MPESPKTTFNVGRIEGGTSVNSIARTAWMEVDMRSIDSAELEKLDTAFQAAVAEAVVEENEFWARHATSAIARVANTRTPLTVKIESVGRRPAGHVPDDAPILQAVRRADSALGITSKFDASSTDSNLPISLGIPAVTLRSGGAGAGYHSLDENFDSKESHLGTQRAFLTLLEVAGLAD